MDQKRKDSASRSRRRFLTDSTAIIGGAVAAAAAPAGALADDKAPSNGNLPPNVPEWMKAPGADVGSQPYGTPSPFEKNVIRNIPKNQPQYTSSASRTPIS